MKLCIKVSIFSAIAVAVGLQFSTISYAATTDTAVWLADHAADKATAVKKDKSGLDWYEGTVATLEGRAFADTQTSYSRLSLRHKTTVPESVWGHGKASAGVALRFITDSPGISVSWGKIEKPMPHMAWTGSGGVDLYARVNDKWEFRAVGQPRAEETLAVLQHGDKHQKKPTEYLMFLPLYSSVEELQLGLEPGSALAPASTPDVEKLPVVFYGTSITQGGCASRAGMSHPAILRRWLDRPVINLGFSGSGKCEPALAAVLAEIPATVYVIETVPNMKADMITERGVPFFTALRAKRPDTPILMVESPNVESGIASNAAWRSTYDVLTAGGMQNLHYLAGDKMYQTREEATVDGSHPTDLGFYQMALNYEPVLRRLVAESEAALPAAQ